MRKQNIPEEPKNPQGEMFDVLDLYEPDPNEPTYRMTHIRGVGRKSLFEEQCFLEESQRQELQTYIRSWILNLKHNPGSVHLTEGVIHARHGSASREQVCGVVQQMLFSSELVKIRDKIMPVPMVDWEVYPYRWGDIGVDLPTRYRYLRELPATPQVSVTTTNCAANIITWFAGNMAKAKEKSTKYASATDRLRELGKVLGGYDLPQDFLVNARKEYELSLSFLAQGFYRA